MKSFSELRHDNNAISFEFLMLDIKTAGTFLDVANTTQNNETRRRNVENAEKAYTSVFKLDPGIIMTNAQKADLRSEMEALRARLATFDPS